MSFPPGSRPGCHRGLCRPCPGHRLLLVPVVRTTQGFLSKFSHTLLELCKALKAKEEGRQEGCLKMKRFCAVLQ